MDPLIEIQIRFPASMPQLNMLKFEDWRLHVVAFMVIYEGTLKMIWGDWVEGKNVDV